MTMFDIFSILLVRQHTVFTKEWKARLIAAKPV